MGQPGEHDGVRQTAGPALRHWRRCRLRTGLAVLSAVLAAVLAAAPVHAQATALSPAVSPGVPAMPPGSAWRILKAEWSASDERAFSEFVAALGESDCRTTDACLRHAANIYRGRNPAHARFYADCADLPYVLRAYFAWVNGLPFAYSSAMAPNGRTRDIRYGARGNRVVERTGVINQGGMAPASGPEVLARLVNTVSTAMFRVHPRETRGLPPDHYPVRVAPGAIRPGTVIYDPNGHVAIVYRVEADGRILYMDAHPDNSITRGVYGRKFVRARPGMGAGFKNWRPVRLAGAVRAEDGTLTGGRYEAVPDAALEDHGLEQFFGNAAGSGEGLRDWRRAVFAFEGRVLDYYDWVRMAVAGRRVIYHPVAETRRLVQAICDDLHYRVIAVDAALAAGMHRKAQPHRLPDNIYGTHGEWEIYSTPSRDARLKTSFIELRDEVARFIALADAGSDRVAHDGPDIRADLARAYREAAAACRISYTNSAGQPVTLSLGDVAARLFDLSFDPYHCPERRWGARDPAELASCPDGPAKQAWYAAERRLRNQAERRYDLRMDFTLAQLRARVAGSGVDAPPDISLAPLFSTAPSRGAGTAPGP